MAPPPPATIGSSSDNVEVEETVGGISGGILGLPLLFLLYVAVRYGPSGNFSNYLLWRFSHSNPSILMGYRPQESRDELHELLYPGLVPGALKVRMPKKDDLTTSTADAPVKTDVGPSIEKSSSTA